MEHRATNRMKGVGLRLLREKCGQSLIEVAVMMPLLILLVGYTVDFGYFFMAAANIASSARNAAQYSILGYEGPAQTSVPVAGPPSTISSVTALAMADLSSLAGSPTTTTVEVCTKANGMSGNIPKCTSYLNSTLQGTNTYTPVADPEAPRFVLQRVDVTYTVQPPVPMTLFGYSLLPNLAFHREVSMRNMD
jgi:Flp pilus assembly protein TadG